MTVSEDLAAAATHLSALRDAVASLQAHGYDLLLISPPGPYGEKLRALGLRWEPVPMDRRSLNPIRRRIARSIGKA